MAEGGSSLGPAVRIGSLRWPVMLYRRGQTAPGDGVGIVETALNSTPLHADIQPMGATTFYGSLTADPDRPVTHRIVMRWTGYLDFTHAISRVTDVSDNKQRTEIFRVRRLYEITGRKRFVCIECQLEGATYSGTRQLFADDGTVLLDDAGNPLLADPPAAA